MTSISLLGLYCLLIIKKLRNSLVEIRIHNIKVIEFCLYKIYSNRISLEIPSTEVVTFVSLLKRS